MHMDVSRDPGPGGLADIETEVHPVGMVHVAEGGLTALREAHHFFQGGGLGFFERGHMRVGGNHQVPGRIGIAVQQHKVPFGAQNHQVRDILMDAGRHLTE